MHDLWIIGDTFVKETIGGLHGLKNAAIVKKQPLPYIFRFYNVLDEYSKSSMHCLLHLVNTIINLINSEKHLPKILLIIPDRDLLMQL